MSTFVITDKIQNQIDELSELIQDRLVEIKNNFSCRYNQNDIVEAMWYSLMAGGKRIRPVLVMEFCRVCGGNIRNGNAVCVCY